MGVGSGDDVGDISGVGSEGKSVIVGKTALVVEGCGSVGILTGVEGMVGVLLGVGGIAVGERGEGGMSAAAPQPTIVTTHKPTNRANSLGDAMSTSPYAVAVNAISY